MISGAEIKKILVMRNDGIGDFLLSLPAMQALRQSYPHARISLFSGNWQEEIAKNSRLFDEMIIWNDSGSSYFKEPLALKYSSCRMFKYIGRLKACRFDLGIDFKNNLFNRLLMWLGGVKVRLGFAIGGSKFLLTHRLSPQANLHKSLLYAQLISSLVGSSVSEPYLFRIEGEDKDKTERFLREKGILQEEKLVVVHPVGRWPAKTWPKEKFARLSERLLSLPQIKVIFVGAREDLADIQEIAKMMKGLPVIAAGKLNFLQSAYLIKKSSLFVGNDASPMHMAAIFNIPTIGLFGPTDPKINSPIGENSTVIRKIDVRCPGCFKKRVGRCINPDNFCMDKISVEEVFDLCRKHL